MLKITTPPEFSFRNTLRSHGWLELAPFSYDGDFQSLHRIHRLTDGQVVCLTFSADEYNNILVRGRDGFGELIDTHQQEIIRSTRRIFNLDLDLSDFYALIHGEKRYNWVEKSGAGRLLRAPTVWEDLVKTLMTTNTTWATTRNILKRVCGLGDHHKDNLHTFPTPDQVAGYTLPELNESILAGYRSEYLYLLAQDIVSGTLDVESWQDISSGDDLYQSITKLKGFGPYAAGAMMKLLGRFNKLALDTAIRDMFTREFNHGKKPGDSRVKKHYERYGEWRGLVAWVDLMRTA